MSKPVVDFSVHRAELASLISLMFADCVWDLRNYSDFHPFQNGHSFLQPIQTKIRTEEKNPNPN